MTALVLPRLRADQYAIAIHPAKRKNCAMGRRYGKTTLAGVLSANVLRQHGRSAWVVPTYKNSRAPWRWLLQVFQPLITAGRISISKTDKVITSDQGGFLAIYSADNIDAIRGEWFHLVVNDECAKIAEEAVTDAVEPTLADADGDLINVGTPNGRNWFWRDWQRGKAKMNDEAASWTAPSTANPNPNIQKAAALAQTRVSDRTYRQEWMAEFIDDAGGVFRGVRARATAQRQAPYSGAFTMGLDWGKSNDYSVLSVIDQYTGQQVDMDRFNQIDYVVQRGRVLGMYQRWQPQIILAESNSIGEPIIEQLQRDGLPVQPFHTSNASKALIIEALSLAFEQQAITILDDETQTAELEAYEMTRTSTGLPKYGAPQGLHDDTVMSLALAWHAATGFGTPGV